MIKLHIQGTHAKVIEREPLTTGRVGLPLSVEVEGPEWDELAKVIVCTAGGVTKDVPVIEGAALVVPHECLTKSNVELFVGVYGANSEGDVVIPTLYASAGKIHPGADPSGSGEADPTPSQVAQILAAANEAKAAAKDVKDRADAGEFNGKDGVDGKDGEPGPQGNDAKINGKNAIEISAGENVNITDTPNGIQISAVGGSSGGITDVRVDGISKVTNKVAKLTLSDFTRVLDNDHRWIYSEGSLINNGLYLVKASREYLFWQGGTEGIYLNEGNIVFIDAESVSYVLILGEHTYQGETKQIRAFVLNSSRILKHYDYVDGNSLSQILEAYASKSWVDENYSTKEELNAKPSKEYVDTEVAKKQDFLSALVPISTDIDDADVQGDKFYLVGADINLTRGDTVVPLHSGDWFAKHGYYYVLTCSDLGTVYSYLGSDWAEEYYVTKKEQDEALASRLAIDVSNIGESGRQRIKDIVAEIKEYINDSPSKQELVTLTLADNHVYIANGFVNGFKLPTDFTGLCVIKITTGATAPTIDTTGLICAGEFATTAIGANETWDLAIDGKQVVGAKFVERSAG